MAPECIKDKVCSRASDVFAFGIVLWEIMTREEPYSELQEIQILYGVVHSHLRPEVKKKTIVKEV